MAENREKTYVADVDRSIYDIRGVEHDAYRMESGLTPEIVDKLSKEKGDPVWMQPELLHPGRIVLFIGERVNDLRRQALLHAIGIVLFVADVIDAAVNVRDLTFFLHSDRLAFSQPGCRQSRFH